MDRLWNRFEQTGSIEDYLAWRNSLTAEEEADEREQSARADYQRSANGRQGQTPGDANARNGQNFGFGKGRPFS